MDIVFATKVIPYSHICLYLVYTRWLRRQIPNLTVDTFVCGSCNFKLFIKPEGCLNLPFYTLTVHVNN